MSLQSPHVVFSFVPASPIDAAFAIAFFTVSSSLRNFMDTTGLKSASNSNMNGMPVGRFTFTMASSDIPEIQLLIQTLTNTQNGSVTE